MYVDAYVGAMTKTVALADDAYAMLAAAKQPGESFSDVTRRLVGATGRPSIMAAAGAWRADRKHWEAHKKRIYAERARSYRPPLKVG